MPAYSWVQGVRGNSRQGMHCKKPSHGEQKTSLLNQSGIRSNNLIAQTNSHWLIENRDCAKSSKYVKVSEHIPFLTLPSIWLLFPSIFPAAPSYKYFAVKPNPHVPDNVNIKGDSKTILNGPGWKKVLVEAWSLCYVVFFLNCNSAMMHKE